MAAGVEDRVETVGRNARQHLGIGQLFLCSVIALEPFGRVGLRIICIAGRIKRRLSAFGRCQSDLCTSVLEHVIGGRELFEPETGFVTSVAQLVVGGEYHENFHVFGPFNSFLIPVRASLGTPQSRPRRPFNEWARPLFRDMSDVFVNDAGAEGEMADMLWHHRGKAIKPAVVFRAKGRAGCIE